MPVASSAFSSLSRNMVGLGSGSGAGVRVTVHCDPAVLEEYETLQHRTLMQHLIRVTLVSFFVP